MHRSVHMYRCAPLEILLRLIQLKTKPESVFVHEYCRTGWEINQLLRHVPLDSMEYVHL